METITLEEMRKGVGEYMGLATMPKGNTEAYDKSIKSGLEYCWRYATWRFAIVKDAALTFIEAENAYYTPSNFDILGFRNFGAQEYDVLDDNIPAGGIHLVYDDARNSFKVVNGGVDTRVTYQTKPPAINTVFAFPSADCIFLAAGIMQKFKDNPNSTEAQQEWDILHTKLDQLSGQAFINTPKRVPRNRYDKFGTYTGDAR